MDYEHAKKLLIHEGTSDEGIHVCVRGNTDPGHERMMRIVKAVEVLIATDDLTAPIDRRLAYALHVVALETNVQSHSWQETKPWRNGGFNHDLVKIQMTIYKYLCGSFEFD